MLRLNCGLFDNPLFFLTNSMHDNHFFIALKKIEPKEDGENRLKVDEKDISLELSA